MIVKFTGAQVGATATQYTAGDLIGVLLTLSNVDRAITATPFLTSVTVQDLTAQNAEIDIVFFDANPAATTFTDNAALDIADADLPKIIGFATIDATQYCAFADSSVGTSSPLGGIPFNAASGQSLYACLVARGTPTYGANELGIAFGFVS
jgi:hypothetical protein